MGQRIVLVNHSAHDRAFLSFFNFSLSLFHPSFYDNVWISNSHLLVMIKTEGLWQPVRGSRTCWMMAGLEKSTIVSTLWLLLVLRERRRPKFWPQLKLVID